MPRLIMVKYSIHANRIRDEHPTTSLVDRIAPFFIDFVTNTGVRRMLRCLSAIFNIAPSTKVATRYPFKDSYLQQALRSSRSFPAATVSDTSLAHINKQKLLRIAASDCSCFRLETRCRRIDIPFPVHASRQQYSCFPPFNATSSSVHASCSSVLPRVNLAIFIIVNYAPEQAQQVCPNWCEEA